jgi:hypothetical protein
MGKRKSDELSGVDLSQLMFDLVSENPAAADTAANNDSGSVLVDKNPLWRPPAPSMQGVPRRDGQNRADFLRSSAGLIRTPAKSLVDEIENEESDLATKSTCSSSTPRTPALFRPAVVYTKQPSSFEGDSPCAVDAINHGCMSFWDRSLAWSEDEDDDDDDDQCRMFEPQRRYGDVLEHLSIPKHLGREHAAPQPALTVPTRVRTVESNSRHRLPSAKMFRQTDVDNVTEIHWEEKVLDTSTLELMAKLSL